MRIPEIILIGFICVFCSYTEIEASITFDKGEVSNKTDAQIAKYVDLGIFSGVVLISDKGMPFYKKAFGLANRSTNSPNNQNTKFSIGSMNKSFTRVIILQLIEENKLSYDTKMIKYLDGFNQDNVDKITIDHLLNHSSGFGDYHSHEYFELASENRDVEHIVSILKGMELMFEPGTEIAYSNAGYVILGAIIEKITGKSYIQNVYERIVNALGIRELVIKDVKDIPNRAIGYMKTLDGYIDNEEFISEPLPDGGFYSDVTNIHTFYKSYLHSTDLLSKETKNNDEFFKRIQPLYSESGVGIPIAGGFNGSNTVHLEMLADDISIVVFANMDEPVAEKIAIDILHIIKGKDPLKPVLPAKLNVYKFYKTEGIEYIEKNFEELTVNWFDNDPKDLILNNLGYELMYQGKLDEALDIFKLNTILFPMVANCWDSYGEALLKKGNKNKSLKAYKKALEIDPNIPSAKKQVMELE